MSRLLVLKIIILVLVVHFFKNPALGQQSVTDSVKVQVKNIKPFGQLITGYNYYAKNKDILPSGFNVRMALFGFRYQPSEKIKAVLMFDAAPTTRDIALQNAPGASVTFRNGSNYTIFMKLAQFEYTFNSHFILTAGQMLTDQYLLQRKFWDHLYVYYPFMEQYIYGVPADFGVKFKVSPFKQLHFTASVTNGDGPFKKQDDNADFSYAGLVEWYPYSHFFTTFYYDYYPPAFDSLAVRSAISAQAGYKSDNFTIAAEFNNVRNNLFVKNYNWGVSLYSYFKF